MSLHLGNDFVISSKHIVVILNIQNLPSHPILSDTRWNFERVRKIGAGPYRAAVLSTKGTVYYSPIDSLTLARRLNNRNQLFNLLEEEYGKNGQRSE